MAVGRDDQPSLWRLVDEVAEAVGTRAPERLILAPGANAAVWERTRFGGLVGGPRTMEMGLCLLQVLGPDELRAVVAHELGQRQPQSEASRSDGVLLQAALSMPLRKGRRLVMEDTALHWGDTTIRYADITGFAYLITSQSMNGVPSTTAYQVDVHTASGRTRIAFTAASVRSGRVKGERQDLWLTIVGILSEKVEPRLIREFTDQIAAGGQVVIGPLTLDQRGITAKRTAAAPIAKVLNSRMTPKAAPWSSYLDTGHGQGNGMTEVYVTDPGSRKGRSRIAVMPNLEPSSGLLPDLLRTLADRFATV